MMTKEKTLGRKTIRTQMEKDGIRCRTNRAEETKRRTEIRKALTRWVNNGIRWKGRKAREKAETRVKQIGPNIA